MNERTTYRLTLPELAATAARHLATSDVDQSSGRVSDVPSSRTIRYYASHGLLDAPLDWEGRTAIYGPRHVMQLVAIKRLQAKGLALSAIQERLHGLGDEALEEIARLSDLEVVQEEATRQAPSRRSSGAFWEARGTRERSEGVVVREAPDVGAMRLDDEVLLVLEGLTRTLDDDDRHALRVAAEPLLHMIKARRLVAGTPKGGQHE